MSAKAVRGVAEEVQVDVVVYPWHADFDGEGQVFFVEVVEETLASIVAWGRGLRRGLGDRRFLEAVM